VLIVSVFIIKKKCTSFSGATHLVKLDHILYLIIVLLLMFGVIIFYIIIIFCFT